MASGPPAGTSLFVYGTLMSEELLQSLTGRRFPRCPATLEDYTRIFPHELRGYPHIVPRQGERVTGVLIENVDPTSLRALDAYEDEGRFYLRRPIEVTARGERVACETYLANLAGVSHR